MTLPRPTARWLPFEMRTVGAPRPGRSRRAAHVLLTLGLGLGLGPSSSGAEETTSSLRRWLQAGCDPARTNSVPDRLSDAHLDLYNGLLYFGVATGLNYGGRTTRHWSAVNSLDDSARGELRLDKSDDREDADFASDVGVGLAVAVLPVASIVSHRLRTGDCDENFDMMTDFVESFSLSLMLGEMTKLAAGRKRPFVRECSLDPPPDASCNGRQRFRSFLSGHATIAATGAGLACAYAIRREAWGTGTAAKAWPCGIGIATALATGGLRVAADRHWVTDVAIGLGLGAAVGYFDTWGPFDWLKIEERDAEGRLSKLGLLMPEVGEGRYGARLTLIF